MGTGTITDLTPDETIEGLKELNTKSVIIFSVRGFKEIDKQNVIENLQRIDNSFDKFKLTHTVTGALLDIET